MKTRSTLVVVGLLVGMALWVQSFGPPAWAKLRLGRGADIQVDGKTVRAIEAAFIQAEEAINTGNLEALMELYSKDYRFGRLTKDDMRTTWKDFFAQYHRISTSHSFSRIGVQPGKRPTAEVTCTGSLWATSNESNLRVNLASWLGNFHYLIYEQGKWQILGQGLSAPKTSQFGGAPPPLF